MSRSFRSNGKLLLSGEYLVLEGAEALAVPSVYGQVLNISENQQEGIEWKSLVRGEEILEASFDLQGNTISSNDQKLSDGLTVIFKAVIDLTSEKQLKPLIISSELEFPMQWGLGSSSTLINNLADCFDIDPFKLLSKTFGGSAYDIACARVDSPILYQITENEPKWKEVSFNPHFSDQIHFVNLNQKMNSREAMEHFKGKEKKLLAKWIQRVSEIGSEMIEASGLEKFGNLMEEHEGIMSEILEIKPVKERLFKDYDKPVKSLGAWGGDFIMAIGDEGEMDYFRKRGYETILSFNDMVLMN